ncbi:MAG: hypothetical protein Fur0024_3600 [Patescibacteria group bacterium]
MENKDEKKKLKLILALISSIEGELESIKKMISVLSSEKKSDESESILNLENNDNKNIKISNFSPESELEEGENSIFGIFDGGFLKAENGKIYPVNPNYASKSRLVYGDRLKMIVQKDGKIAFKPVELVERRWVIGELMQENGEYKVICDGVVYNILFASVTFYKAKPGDKLSIILPKEGKSPFATIDSILPDT